MRTANRTHPSFNANPNLGGAGTLDVANAVTFLENLGNSPEQELVLVFPNLLLSEPAFVAFPGNRFEQKILLLSASPGVYTFEVEGSIKPFIELEETSIHLRKRDVVPVNLTVSLPFDINPTIYDRLSGHLNVQMDGELVERLPFHPIDVRHPKLRVYFDNFHNRGPSDTPFGNFFAFTKLLRNKSIDVVVHDAFISYEALASFDILLLPDVELMFSWEEIQAIHQFLEAGGDLIVLGAEKESIAAEAINELLDPFGITLTETIEFATDQGLRRHHEENLNVTAFSPHPLTQDVAALTWKAGVGLTVDGTVSNTRTLATITFDEIEHAVLAVHEATPPHHGSVIVLGTDFLFYDDLLNETGTSNRQLAENLFEWLAPDSELLPVMLVNKTRAAPGDTINIMTYVLTSETSKPTPVTDLILTVTLPNGTELLLTKEYAKTPFELIPGIYSYTYTLPADTRGHFTFKASSSQFEKRLYTVVNVIETEPQVISTEMSVKTGGRDIVEPGWVILFDEPKLDRYDDRITFEATITHADQATLYLTFLGAQLSELSKQSAASYAFPMKADSTHQHWSYEWHPNASIPAGLYAFFVFPTTTDGIFPLTATNSTGKFILLDSEPVIDEANTSFDDRSIQELEELLDRDRIITLGTPTVRIEIEGEDLEDSSNELEAFVVVVELSVFIVNDYVLAVSPVPYNTQTRKFEADFILPENLLSTPKGQLPEDSILVFFFILRDSDGEFGDALAPAALRSSLLPFGQTRESFTALGLILMASLYFLDPMLGMVVVFVATSLLVWLLLQKLRR